tara:strand:- start:128 stop:355 length:228 start_codon:yes stop_codon:yes gene_type:complete
MEAALKDVGFQTVRRVPINSASLAKVRGWSPVDWGYENRENVVGVYEPPEGGQVRLFQMYIIDRGEGGVAWDSSK